MYDALNKYGIDFTERARQGKLDPVIGRDDEIRRAIQILSRRTKNNPVLIGTIRFSLVWRQQYFIIL
jgi:ATP-dependent Clp protease ATP-binding subunit ClpB